MILESYDEDIKFHDFIGATRAVAWQDLCDTQEEREHTLLLYDKKIQTGSLKIKTKFTFVPLKKTFNMDGTLSLYRGTTTYATTQILDNLTFAMRANIEKKMK